MTASGGKRWVAGLLVTAAVVALQGAGRGAQKAPAKRPNILFAISDDQSWPHTSADGCKGVRTPAFDWVARTGIRFTHAFSASPGCSPSRAAILTGRHTWQVEHAGTHASSFSAKYQVYPDLLENAGYHVGYTGKGWGPGNWKEGGRTRNPAGPDYNAVRLKEKPLGGVAATDYAGNFRQFLAERKPGQPFCFWYGGSEPHRVFEKGSGLKAGKKLEDAEVPPYLPDTPEVRSDLLDYYLEIEWFDRHLGQMLETLEKAGELDNTLVVVTSDNGMSFPRAKANCYDDGFRLPLAISWPAKIPGGRVVEDLISFIDFAPTFLEATGLKPTGAMTGRSMMSLLTSRKQGRVDPSRDRAFTARERHSSSRYNNHGYPIRALRTREYLYIRNFHPERWPAGDPRLLEDAEVADRGDVDGYFDIDAAPSKAILVTRRDDSKIAPFLHWSVGKRPAEELYAIEKDPACLKNLATDPVHAAARKRLRDTLDAYLKETGDPRLGNHPEIFETYPRYSRIRKFPPSP